MKILLAPLLLCLLVNGQTPSFQDASRRQKIMALTPQVDAIFEKYFQGRQVPGMVYGLVIDQDLVHVRSWGIRDTASKAPVNADTAFRIASMTKSFTALAILKLRDAGKLSLDDKVSRWVPEIASLAYPTKDTAPITVRQLLTHGAGFPEDNPWGDRQLAIPDAEMSKWVDRGIPFSTPPDTSYEYSNYGFALLGRIVAKASGQSYEQYLDKEILKPLGLSSASLEPARVPASVRANGYGRRDGELFEIPSLAHGSFGAMGGLVINAKDMGRYVAYHLSAEPARDDADNGPVRRSSLREMQRQWRTSSQTSGYGYGLSVSRNSRFSRIVAHGGGLPGFGSYMMWLPEYSVGMFAMANLTYAGPAAPMREALEMMAVAGALKPRVLAPSPILEQTQKVLTQLWNNWSDADMDRIAADNLYLDQPRALIAKRIADLKKKLTNCQPQGPVTPENWLRGHFQLACTEGQVEVTFTLAPTKPPLVQALSFKETLKPTAPLED
jgi:CubicO group peptidase (beta-lactamase class C family)